MAASAFAKGILYGINLSLGADTALTPNVRVGMDTGYSTNHVGVSARGSKASITAGHVGGYVYGSFDAVRVSAGLGYGFGDASVNRAVSFTGFTDATSSSQGADTFQFFAEAGYAFTMPSYTLEPFAGIDWTTLNMGAFREAGGSAALAGTGKRMEQATTTFGLALSVPMDGMITPSFRAGLQHAISNDTASRALSFVSSGQSFTVLGTPLDADRAVIDANLGFNLGGARLMAGYSGAFGTRTTDHAIKAMAAVDF